MERTGDLDDVLRRLAARDQPAPLDGERGWARVHQLADDERRARRRVRRRALALATALGLLLIGVTTWREAGTEDFTYRPAASPRANMDRFTHGNSSFLSPKDSKSTSDERRERAEQTAADFAAGEMQLVKVTGVTLKGRIALAGIYQSRRRPDSELVSSSLDTPLNSARTPESTQDFIKFWTLYRQELPRLVTAPTTVPLGPTEFTANGLTVRCERWRLELPEFGTVIYWVGAPVTGPR